MNKDQNQKSDMSVTADKQNNLHPPVKRYDITPQNILN